jgi:hypothetical protein
MCVTELAMNTATADRRMGSQREERETTATSAF